MGCDCSVDYDVIKSPGTFAVTHVKVKKRVEVTSSRLTVMDTGMYAPDLTRSSLPVAISALSTQFIFLIPKTQHNSTKQYVRCFVVVVVYVKPPREGKEIAHCFSWTREQKFNLVLLPSANNSQRSRFFMNDSFKIIESSDSQAWTNGDW